MAYLQMQGISKSFGQLQANSEVDLSVERGEIHGLMGENGAGKSTLMSILYGLLPPDSGTIAIDGRPLTFSGPLDAIAAGIGMVHQGFKLFNGLRAWENLVYHKEPTNGPLIAVTAAKDALRSLGRHYDMPVDPDAVVGELPIGVRQRLEILKALYRDARMLILDEPTAVLTPQERDNLFAALRRLADRGISIILVTHKIPEVMAIADRVTVLRDGRAVARLVTRESSQAEIVRAMTGRDVASIASEKRIDPDAAAVLSVSGLFVSQGGRTLVDNVSFQVRAGEIVGLAGIAGNGQSELISAICGLTLCSGQVRIAGQDVSRLSVACRRAAGFAYVPEDRHATGTAPGGSIVDNIVFGKHRKPAFSRLGLLRTAEMRRHAEALIARFGVKVENPAGPIGSLSGGNMQKVIVARELEVVAPLIIAEQPTRGVDIGAIEFIHSTLLQERGRNRAVLIVSSELSELLALSDRILVMYRGRIVAELYGQAMNEMEVGRWMTGVGAAN